VTAGWAVRITSEAQLDRDNPWPGLASYDESSFSFFSGRSTESAELLRRILDEPITVLFGKSGLGKTSLLKAGVFSRLRERGGLPILIRLQMRTGSEPLSAQVRHALFEELRSLDVDHPEIRADETLWEYLHRAGQELWTTENRLVRPVFVFDQFEELFTLGRAVQFDVDAFREDLADLAENRIPAALATRLGDRPASEIGLDVQAMPYKIVVSLREDFLADLESWRVTIPSLRRNRMRLLPMGPVQAFEAVHNSRTSHLVSEAIGRKIVAFLSSGAGPTESDGLPSAAGPTVEPALLSLFCRGVNEHRKRDGKTEFDLALLEGGKDTIVSDFYRASLADQPLRVRMFIEDDLITEHGYRNSYSVEDAIARQVITAKELETLINRHLVRHEHHLGTERIELTHDLLTKAVVDERDERRVADVAVRSRRQRLRLTALAAALALVAVVFAGLAIGASRAETRANAEKDRSQSRELAAVARTKMNADPELAILLALAGLERSDTADARAALLEASRYTWPSAILGTSDLDGVPDAIALSADGSRLVVLAAGETITLWDVNQPRQPARLWKATVSKSSSSIALSLDQKLIAVAGPTSVTLLDAQTGRVARQLAPQPTIGTRRVVFSPDGRWLASTEDFGSVRVVNILDESAPSSVAQAPGVVGFTILNDKRLIAVSDPLAAIALEEQPDRKWKAAPFDLPACIRAQSVSPGAQFFSATWRAHACMYRADTGSPVNQGVADRAIEDIIWSAGGSASAELLVRQEAGSQDLFVGRNLSGPFASQIKGAHLDDLENEKSRLISVSESGTRMALIDQDDEHRLVRIYSLAGHKPFLSRIASDLFTVAPTGDWLAIGTPEARNQGGSIDVFRIEHGATSQFGTRVRILLDAEPNRLDAAQTSVVVALEKDPLTTVVFDVASGKPLFAPIVGRARPIGGAGQLLLVDPVNGEPWRLLKSRDGSPVTLPGPGITKGEPGLVIVSPGKEAFAIVRRQGPEDSRAQAHLYRIREEAVVPSGRVLDLPADVLSPLHAPLQLADDASTITDPSAQQVWSSAGVKQPATVEGPVTSPAATDSPLGRFQIQQASTDTFTLVRRADQTVLQRFTIQEPGYLFSSDDSWLAIWGRHGVQLVDLSRGDVAFALTALDVQRVDFAARNSIASLQLGEGAMLVPLDRALTERFAKWLAPRSLTTKEQCAYGLIAEGCR
jgi:hypothetical protein